MIEHDPQAIHDDSNKPVPLAFSVTQQRVEHYSDVVEYIVNNEVAKCKADGYTPTKQQVDFLRKEVIRYAIIRRDIDGANKLKIRRGSNILNEADHRLPAWAQL